MIENIRQAFSSLRANKLRSALTLLGIVVGVFSIIGLVVAWQLFDRVYPNLFVTGIRLFYAGYRF